MKKIKDYSIIETEWINSLNVIGDLCYYDERNDNGLDVGDDIEYYKDRTKTKECYCDNCFTGRTHYAMLIMDIKSRLKPLTPVVENSIDSGIRSFESNAYEMEDLIEEIKEEYIRDTILE
jgi:hypothetical protein